MRARLSLCMIVRDEETFLPRCLDSVRGVVDEIVVVDTGSHDSTVDIARRFGATVAEMPWPDDFSAARNASLDLATGDWVLVLDADEVLLPESAAGLPTLLADPGVEGYFIQMRHLIGSAAQPEVEESSLFRLWRNRPEYRFTGEIHEQILPTILARRPGSKTAQSGLQVVHYGYLREIRAARRKFERNRLLLEKVIARSPQDPFAHFNLGIEYYDQGLLEQAGASFAAALARARPGDVWRPKLVKAYAATLLERKEWASLFRLLEEEIARYPDYTDLHYLKGVARVRAGQTEQAVSAFTRCLELGPAPALRYTSTDPGTGSYKAQLELGAALEALGRDADAREAYRRAARSRPGWHEPLKRLATLLGRTAGDEEVVEELRAFFPGWQYADRVQVATLLLHAHRPRLAVGLLEPFRQAGRADRAGLFVLARGLAEAGDREGALAICRGDWSGSPLAPQVQRLREELEAHLPGAQGAPAQETGQQKSPGVQPAGGEGR